MNNYGISFKQHLDTICIEAEDFIIEDGFVKLMKMNDEHYLDCFAAYNSDNVLHIVKQNKYTEEEILA